MLKFTIFLSGVALLFVLFSTGSDVSAQSTGVLNYDDGTKKDVFEKKGDLYLSRELYSKEGKLIEKHIFDADKFEEYKGGFISRGLLTTYYDDGTEASVVPVIQQKKQDDSEYYLYISNEIKGYYKGGKGVVAYSYSVIDPVLISADRADSYNKRNAYYPDIFLLYGKEPFKGLVTEITNFNEDGSISSIGEITDGLKSGKWQFNNTGGKTESEGQYKKHGLIEESKVGKWMYYYPDGTKKAVEEYYPGGRSGNLKIGDLISLGLYYYPDGKLKCKVKYAEPADDNIRMDTLEVYNEQGILVYKYFPDEKMPLFNPVTGGSVPYEYSAKAVWYYGENSISKIGFRSNIPRKKVNQQTLDGNPCIMEEGKKVGYWYEFDTEGQMTSVLFYNLCGNVKQKYEEKEVKKLGKEYAKTGILNFDARY